MTGNEVEHYSRFAIICSCVTIFPDVTTIQHISFRIKRANITDDSQIVQTFSVYSAQLLSMHRSCLMPLVLFHIVSEYDGIRDGRVHHCTDVNTLNNI